jgi:uncharacterized protein (TIGR03000 family)
LKVTCPPETRIFVNGQEMSGTGPERQWPTPPLEPGEWSYTLRACWQDQCVIRTVSFQPGQTVHVQFSPEDFRMPHQNFGLNLEKLHKSEEDRVLLNDRPISLRQAEDLLRNGLPDDRHKLRLTIIGSTAERQKVRADLEGPLAVLAQDFLIQDYPPDHWAVAQAGFVTSGHPTIYVQAPDGKVLHRQDDYQDGAAGLRTALEKIRKPNPDYRPERDVDLRQSSPMPEGEWLVLLGLLLFAWFWWTHA